MVLEASNSMHAAPSLQHCTVDSGDDVIRDQSDQANSNSINDVTLEAKYNGSSLFTLIVCVAT